MQRIAIIGIGCRFPGGADSAAGYWSLLTEGRCAIAEIPTDRWSLTGFHDATPDLPDRSYAKWGGFLQDISGFDPGYFGLSPREAEAMDPQQRLLLQVVCEAASDSRLPIAALRRANTGVFIGVSNVDYGLLQRYRPDRGDIQAGTGTALSIVANRVSNRLDLSGPSMGIDTACSSSLVAVDTACRHLADGSCDMALAGGVSILLDPRMFITFSRAHMLSPTGRIRAFDAAADGFVRGEGVGIVLLRRLEDALAAGDRIYAVIEATGVNQDGRTGTITEPSRDAQIAMLERVVARAGISPADVDYVEAHGTGTPVGDPIEANAIGTVLGGKYRRAPLLLGSAKTNLGHLEPAAGIAGLIKTALVLHHGLVPPSLGFEQPNPAIEFDALNLAVVRQTRQLPEADRPARALVNSFGFGGTNACALMSAVSSQFSSPKASLGLDAGEVGSRAGGGAPQDQASRDVIPIAVPLSAPTPRHLQLLAAALAREIESGCLSECSGRAIAAALSMQRDHHTHRAVVIATTPTELAERLRCLAEGREWPQAERHAAPQIIRGIAKPDAKLCFTMTGQGGQWWAMGRELIEREPVFQASIESFDRVFAPIGGWSVMDALLADEATSRIDDAAITPAVMFAFQTALAEVWRTRGVTPDIVLGHSFGEVTAAYLAGGLAAAEIARLVDQRGLIRHAVDRVGTMAAIGLGADEIAPLLPADGSIEIGGYNSPDMVTLTGEEAAIDRLIARLNVDDPSILTRKLALDFAYHSSWFEPVEHVFKAQVGSLRTAPPRLPVVSTVTGKLNDRFDTEYWWQNLRRPVRYQQGIETALDLGADVFVELGPHRTLSSMTAACATSKGREIVTVTSLDRRWGDLVSLAVATGQLYVAGVEIDWAELFGTNGRTIALPPQPWDNQKLWLVPDEAVHHLRPAAVHPLLGRAEAGPGHAWLSDISLATHGWLGDHRLDGACVFPAAAYLEMLTVAARTALGADAIELLDVSFPAALFIGSDDEIQLATRFEPSRRKLTIHSRIRGNADWTERAAAYGIAVGSGDRASGREQGHTPSILVSSLELKTADVAAFYLAAREAGYGWGHQFQGLAEIRRGSGAASGVISLPPLPGTSAVAFHLDPRLIDSALQLMLASGNDEQMLGMMPVGIARVIVSAPVRDAALAAGRTVVAAGGIAADIEIAAPDGATVVRIDGLKARRRAASERTASRVAQLYSETAQAITFDSATASVMNRWVVIANPSCRHGEQIVAGLQRRGAACEILDPRGDVGAHLRSIGQSASPLDIIYAAPVGMTVDGPGDIGTAAIKAVQGIIALGRILTEIAARGARMHLTVLTRGARQARASDAIDDVGLAQSPVLAAARTIAMEVPALTLDLVDCDRRSLEHNGPLLDVLAMRGTVGEIALREDRTFAFQIEALGAAGPPPPRTVKFLPGNASDFVLSHAGAPAPDGLYWRRASPRTVGPDDVEVDVATVGLNFRDLMAVSALLPAEAESQPAVETLGLELSGSVRSVGRNVLDLEPGDRVLGMGRGVLARRAVLPRLALHRVPRGLSYREAATIPSAYMTAHYALNELARLKPGEIVLVHSATGGVGQAAISLARQAGAQIIATAGTPERRAYLRERGIVAVFDSRSLGFADGVMRVTKGRGVDVVLNSLRGPLIEKGFACLAPFGRFIELGKRDVYENAALGLKALRSNISLHVVDLAALLGERPAIAARLLGEVMAMLAAREIEPLPNKVFEAARVAEAFRHFASGRHFGKVVVDIENAHVDVQSAFGHCAPFDADGTYLVTGGTRGFGLAVGRWLAARGAGRVVLASRSGAMSEVAGVGSCCIESLALDVTQAADVECAIGRLSRGDKPLRGVFHAAVAYDDGLLADMSLARIDRVLAPKITGALNLTQAVEKAGVSLGHFVTFSSLAQVVGWPGQSNYAAANGFLEALASWQRSRGIPGQCVNWGALGESGYVARSAQMKGYLESSGWIVMDNATALDHLARALDIDLPSITIAAADWQRLAAAHPALGRSSRMARLLSGASSGTSGRGLLALEGPALDAAALELVRAQTARVLRARIEDIAPTQTLAATGIDSLSSFELHNRLGQEAGLELPMPRYVKARRIDEVAALLVALVVEARTRITAEGQP